MHNKSRWWDGLHSRQGPRIFGWAPVPRAPPKQGPKIFRNFSGNCTFRESGRPRGPGRPFKRVGREKCCRTHIKLAPQTNSNAVSWHFSEWSPSYHRDLLCIVNPNRNSARPSRICTRSSKNSTRTSQNVARAVGPSKDLRGSSRMFTRSNKNSTRSSRISTRIHDT